MNNLSVSVIGAGSWGTALAILLAKNGITVTLWGRGEDAMQSMADRRENSRYLPGIPIPDLITPTADFDRATSGASNILLVVPSHSFPSILQRLAHNRSEEMTLVWGSKGLAPGSGLLLSELVQSMLGDRVTPAVISGPSFAAEIAKGLPAALTVGAKQLDVAEDVAGWFRNERVRIYPSDDLAGVQLGGAIKNIMAIATGISDGLRLGANSRAALITRGLAEMNRLALALGGRMETIMGLTGVGDLILTCTDDQSRNRRVGLGLGRGQTLRQVLDSIGQEAEGVDATRELFKVSERIGVEMPITAVVYQVLFEGLAPMQAVDALLRREPVRE